MEKFNQANKLLRQVAENPQHHTKALENFKTTYEGLQIGPYSDEVLQDVIENATANISPKFKALASEQLDKSGITSPLLKANLLKGCDEVLNQFELAISGLYNSAVEYNKKQEFDRITKTQMKAEGIYLGGNSLRTIQPTYKSFQCGFVSGALVTTCNKSIDIDSSNIRIIPGNDTYYIYAKWPRSGGPATLVVFTEPKGNTNTDLYIFWKSGTFNEIPF